MGIVCTSSPRYGSTAACVLHVVLWQNFRPKYFYKCCMFQRSLKIVWIMDQIICEICGKSLANRNSLRTHRSKMHKVVVNRKSAEKIGQTFTCEVVDCGKSFAKSFVLKRHMAEVHSIQKSVSLFSVCHFFTFVGSLSQGGLSLYRYIRTYLIFYHIKLFYCIFYSVGRTFVAFAVKSWIRKQKSSIIELKITQISSNRNLGAQSNVQFRDAHGRGLSRSGSLNIPNWTILHNMSTSKSLEIRSPMKWIVFCCCDIKTVKFISERSLHCRAG